MHVTTGRVRGMTGTGDRERKEELALPTAGPPDEPIRQRGWRSRPRITDLLIAALYAGPALAVTAIVHETNGLGFILQLLAVVVSGAALLFRRRAPMFSLAAAAGIMLITFPAPTSFAAVATAMALYAVAVYRSTRHAACALLGTSGVLLLAAVLPGSIVDPGQAGQAIAVLVIAALVGFNVRSRRSYVAALVDRADRLVRERQHLASIAAAAERNAIAREMHDIVSHGLAVMISLAHGSAEIAPSDPARAAAAMRQVAETGRTAVSDMRRMLGVLNVGTTGEPPGTVVPAPGVGDVPALVEPFRSTGLPVVLRSAGVPPADPGIQLAIYRVVQEGLTNALKYAREASAVVVGLQFSADEITVSVTDDGQHEVIPAGHLGRGLVGMRERVALYGGTMEAGPMVGRGWSVTARFVPQEGASWNR
ncbi:signal transduction histidine kinase [Arthrobacter sp. MP_M7]|nr:signal transduction histidine kinase [Arthrobacter sp. MP_M4]MEC5204553.1 signal transduction histidine kinase [Arthrobacter sp. MP_M7]